ncbi:transposase [Rhodococcus sp. HM1]|uniref:transposase n=1 Tax=Rhodococcus sp. HM1 TaxID=2937759 RepID=UPI00200A496B|nr:transposase [Rhodococcus sp. HM1]MCK8675438.1 transposase [Rhodococcus sp. HM1]
MTEDHLASPAGAGFSVSKNQGQGPPAPCRAHAPRSCGRTPRSHCRPSRPTSADHPASRHCGQDAAQSRCRPHRRGATVGSAHPQVCQRHRASRHRVRKRPDRTVRYRDTDRRQDPCSGRVGSGRVGSIGRFRSAAAFASYTGTAPIEVSSGDVVRHRLSRAGDRQLNYCLHTMAITQIARDTPGRAYYQRKRADGKSHKEALRCLKRRLSDVVSHELLRDSVAEPAAGPLIYNVQTEGVVTANLRDTAQRAGVPMVEVTETLPEAPITSPGSPIPPVPGRRSGCRLTPEPRGLGLGISNGYVPLGVSGRARRRVCAGRGHGRFRSRGGRSGRRVPL